MRKPIHVIKQERKLRQQLIAAAKERYDETRSFEDRFSNTYKLLNGRVRYMFSAISIVTGTLFITGKLNITLPVILSIPIALIIASFIEKLKYQITPTTIKHLLQKQYLRCLMLLIPTVCLFAASVYFSVSFIRNLTKTQDQTVLIQENSLISKTDSISTYYDSLVYATKLQLDLTTSDRKSIQDKSTELSREVLAANQRLQDLENGKFYAIRKLQSDSASVNDLRLTQDRYDNLIRSQQGRVDILLSQQQSTNNMLTNAPAITKQLQDRMTDLEKQKQLDIAQLREDNNSKLVEATNNQYENIANITLLSYFVEFMILFALVYAEWYLWKIYHEQSHTTQSIKQSPQSRIDIEDNDSISSIQRY